MAIDEGVSAREWLMAVHADAELTQVHLVVAAALAKGQARVDESQQSVFDDSVADMIRLGYLVDEVVAPVSGAHEEHLLRFRDPRAVPEPESPAEEPPAAVAGGLR